MPATAPKTSWPEPNLRDQVLGLVLLALAVFGVASLVASEFTQSWTRGAVLGSAGGFFISLLQALAGKLVYGLPLLIGGRGYQLVRDGCRQPLSHRAWGIIIGYLAFLLAFHLPLAARLDGLTTLQVGVAGEGGGLVGAVLAWAAYRAVGIIGTYVLLGTLFLLSFTLITGLPLQNTGRFLGRQLANLGRRGRQSLARFLFEEVEEGGEEEKVEVAPAVRKRSRESPPAPAGGKGTPDGAVEQSLLASVAPGEMADGDSEGQDVSADDFQLPPLGLLQVPKSRPAQAKEAADKAKLLEDTLESFGIKVTVAQVSHGPTITRYEVQPAPGIKVSRITSLADDIALSMAAPGVRIEAPIPGKAALGIEVPNKEITPVHLREVLATPEFQRSRSRLALALGKDIAGTPVAADLGRMPHLLIAGATGSGKSVCLNSLICSLLYKNRPSELRLLMIDPKMVELTHFNEIPHLLTPVITDAKKAAVALRWMVSEMEHRYELFATAGVRDITGYNRFKAREPELSRPALPLYVIVIDELADLMMVSPVEVEEAICRLAQMARAAGIHLVVATQRPSVDVITGIIKANIPSRIAFAVSSQTDSRTILDCGGAEKLLGRGDMLFLPVGAPKPIRLQGVFVSDREVERIVEFLKAQRKPEYVNGITQGEISTREEEENDDALLPEAVRVFLESGQASISLLQRRLRIGYARAARLVDLMEARGIVGEYEGSKPRPVLIGWDDYHRLFGKF